MPEIFSQSDRIGAKIEKAAITGSLTVLHASNGTMCGQLHLRSISALDKARFYHHFCSTFT